MQTVIELVLGTDMKQHFSIQTHFCTMHRINLNGGGTPVVSGENALSR